MKKIKTTRRLRFNCETLRTMQLAEANGAGIITAPSKPQASCFILCLPTNTCPPTADHCVLLTANC